MAKKSKAYDGPDLRQAKRRTKPDRRTKARTEVKSSDRRSAKDRRKS